MYIYIIGIIEDFGCVEFNFGNGKWMGSKK